MDHGVPPEEFRALISDKAVEDYPDDEQKQVAYVRECHELSTVAKKELLKDLRIHQGLRDARARKRKRDEQEGSNATSSTGGGERRGKFVKEGFEEDQGAGARVLILATGSVATVKVPEIAVALSKSQRLRDLAGGEAVSVKVVTSECGGRMMQKCAAYDAKTYKEFEGMRVDVLHDVDEWEGYEDVRSDKVVHIELRRWADICIIAPCSANTLAKAACGLTDNLVMSVLRAWDPSKPLIVAPAMNTVMWEHPKTAEHLDVLLKLGYTVVPPAVKKLACNDTGRGALAQVEDIVSVVCTRAAEQSLHSTVRYAPSNKARLESTGIGKWAALGFPEWKG